MNSEGAKADGTPIYQSIYAWAHNNGIQIDEDHAMLSDGIYRRDSQMLSSALRFGTTRHMTVGEHSGLVDQWIRNDDSPAATAHNIGLLALKEAEIVMKRLSDIEGLRYDIPNQAFYDGEYRIPDAEIETYLRRRIGKVDTDFSRRIGPATLRRALAVIAAEGAGGTGRVRLVGEAAEAPRPLHGLLYAKDAGGESASERREGAGAGAEPAGVSGEAGRGGSGQGLKAGPERTAQVRGWTEEIRAGWGSRLDVVVHDSAEGIGDTRLRQAVLEEGGNVAAFFDPKDGRIHLLADRVASKVDAERLLRHEGIHWAINGKLGKEYASILDGVRKLISDTEWKKIGKDYPNASDRVRVEEYLANLGQKNPKAKAWEKFAYEVKKVLKEYFGRDFEVTDADVRAFLDKANRKVESGGKNTAVTARTAENDLRYARASDAKYREIDQQWWKDFAAWREKRSNPKKSFSFGPASDELILAGFPDAEIILPARVLEIKPASEKHPFPVTKLFNLPKKLRDPVMVFRSRTVADAMTALTEIKHENENLLVAVHFRERPGGTQEISSIQSVYPKNDKAMLGWIEDGLATYYHKEKAYNWLFQQATGSNSRLAWFQLQATKNIKTNEDVVKK